MGRRCMCERHKELIKRKLKIDGLIAFIQIAEEFWFLKRAESLRTDPRRAPSVQTKIRRLKRKRNKHIQ